MLTYFASLRPGKITLWCYLIWYITTVFYYFDANPRLWLNSLGISAVIGIALMLSVSSPGNGKTDRWQVFRLFAMPFCVSSFSSLIKDHGFVLIIPPRWQETLTATSACVAFVLLVTAIRLWHRRANAKPQQ